MSIIPSFCELIVLLPSGAKIVYIEIDGMLGNYSSYKILCHTYKKGYNTYVAMQEYDILRETGINIAKSSQEIS